MSVSREDNYTGVFDGKVGFGRNAAVVVIDFTLAYTTPGSPFFAEGVVRAVADTVPLLQGARAAGIPARVVTGYQGGQVNPVSDYILIRQADAHANRGRRLVPIARDRACVPAAQSSCSRIRGTAIQRGPTWASVRGPSGGAAR